MSTAVARTGSWGYAASTPTTRDHATASDPGTSTNTSAGRHPRDRLPVAVSDRRRPTAQRRLYADPAALRWSRLERRRNLARRVLLYKFLHGDYTIPDGYLRRSRRDPSKLDQRLARTTSASFTIFVQAPALWNSLPANARRAPDVAEFKDLVRNLDLNV
ncbi:hypothetical protein HPB47_002715 [Ixodes persulcatus]|uniref:Uncharacterized protein n=1 Tax=Ixodes persulcatus TaxID=34615 RepID=A0AC60PKF3_IXOPE|nr:hypothetical protein HPB47_002715 [Ixodes persulcatus]